MKMEQTECSETSAHKIQTPGNYPEEDIQHRTSLSAVFCSEFIARARWGNWGNVLFVGWGTKKQNNFSA